ncbi:hypothetical protein [Pseudomonas eucalypticola]|uniref:Uncharacterized protein n=1 Tax=Pseudomonas eucalypticola TaxID=2599595 RepID=A0A7D5HDF6_9PSED|nr:hypothetical protein [Pseudomonas eucalypticola]QKZ04710.1 hypothetical protein HWQ56_13305 [Pseudomonas eucalypticola]
MSDEVNHTKRPTGRFNWEFGAKHFHATTMSFAISPAWGVAGQVDQTSVEIGEPHLLLLEAELGFDGLNDTFTLGPHVPNEKNPTLVVLTKTADGSRRDLAKGTVTLRISGSGFGVGIINAEVNKVRLRGDFAIADTSTSTGATLKRVDGARALESSLPYEKR